MKSPVAYVRRSSVSAANPGEISHADQLAAVRELAHRHGFNGDLVIYDDWGKSADAAKESKRTAFNDMLRAVERGEVSHIFAAKVDRLYRSGKTFYRLIEAAKQHGVHVDQAGGRAGRRRIADGPGIRRDHGDLRRA